MAITMAVHIVLASLISGTAMGIGAMMMHVIGFTQLSIVNYLGCFFTGSKSGIINFVSGLFIHFFILSIVIGFIYALAFKLIWGHAGLIEGILLGIVHWFITGLILPFLDSANSCVKNKFIPPLKIFATGYGINAVITFLINHLLYGLFMGLTI